jgi:hypothetical protein
MVLFIVLYVCFVSNMFCANLEFGLLGFIAWICSLKCVQKFLPVSPMYFNCQ